MIVKKIALKLRFYRDNFRFAKKGKNTKIIKPMRIIGKKYIYIGKDVTILNNARIEAIDYWANKEYLPKIMIKDGVSIEQNCHIIAADELIIDEDVVISADVYIADCQERFDQDKRIMESDLVVKKTLIKKGAFIGIGAKIMPGVTIGERSVIGANSVVTKDVPDYTIYAGVPAKYIRDNIISK